MKAELTPEVLDALDERAKRMIEVGNGAFPISVNSEILAALVTTARQVTRVKDLADSHRPGHWYIWPHQIDKVLGDG